MACAGKLLTATLDTGGNVLRTAIAPSTAATPFEPKKSINDLSKAYVTTGTFHRYPWPISIGPPMSPGCLYPFVCCIQVAYGPTREKPNAVRLTSSKHAKTGTHFALTRINIQS